MIKGRSLVDSDMFILRDSMFLGNSMQTYPSQINVNQFHGVKYKMLHTTWMKIINNSLKSIFDYIFRVFDVAQCMAFFHGLRYHTVLILCTLIGTRNRCDGPTWIRISM